MGGLCGFLYQETRVMNFLHKKMQKIIFMMNQLGNIVSLSSYHGIDESFMVRINDAIYDGFQYVYYSGSGKGKTRTDLLYDGNGGKDEKLYAAKPNTKY